MIRERDRPEIEITEEMEIAGASCLWGFEHQVDSAREMAREIFLEMLAARDRVPLQGRPLTQELYLSSQSFSGTQLRNTEMLAEKLLV